MGKAGRVLAIIGAAIGIAMVLLSLIGGGFLSWYHFDVDYGPYSGGVYLTAFGSFIEDTISLPSSYTETAMLVLLGGILVLAGAGLCIVGAATEKKPLGIIGGILMILGPTFLIIDLAGQVSEFSQFMDQIASAYDKSIFLGSFSYGPGSIVWGIGIFPIAMIIGAGVVGLIGGATL